MPSVNQVEKVSKTKDQFIAWLDKFGETSYDHQSYFASPFGDSAKALYYRNKVLGSFAVSPMILSEAFLPSARQLFWKKQRFPIADAHYAMGFALLAQLCNSDEYYNKAKHFLSILENTRCSEYQHLCWGYPFNWQTRSGIVPANTPMITTIPYIYEAFLYLYRIDRDNKWLEILHSIAEHTVNDYKDIEISAQSKSCAYSPLPGDKGGVINASAYRAFLLTHASFQFSEEKYSTIAKQNLNFVLETQQSNGSWYYATDSVRDFVDHFHTCFILKALVKIVAISGDEKCKSAIEIGLKYYLKNLLNDNGLPKPFAKAPRFTVYKQELYDYAEAINLGVMLKETFPEMEHVVSNIINDILNQWLKRDGSFRSRKLLLGWDNVPMHRWAQSQVFRSLCLYLLDNKQDIKNIII